MSSTTVSHVIGTVALIGLFVTVGMNYSIYFSQLREQATVAQLQGIADYISAGVLDLYSVGSNSKGDQFLVKTLDIPSGAAQSSYNVSLVNVSTIADETGFCVLVKLTWEPFVYAQSQLPWDGGQDVSLSSGAFPSGVQSSLLQPKAFVISGISAPAIWYCRCGTNVTLGLGIKT
jgi:hypothetical protein